MTAAVLDLTPTAVIPAELIALNAYSALVSSEEGRANLIETAFRRKYCDMSIISCAACLLRNLLRKLLPRDMLDNSRRETRYDKRTSKNGVIDGLNFADQDAQACKSRDFELKSRDY
jgi:hypothetical protein